MPELPSIIDTNSRVPLYLQVKEYFAQRIREGTLPPGSRLPAVRTLASQLGVNKVTVITAYTELAAEGMVASHVGRGTYVTFYPSEGSTSVQETAAKAALRPGWQLRQGIGPQGVNLSRRTMVRDIMRLAEHPHIISFASGSTGNEMFPVAEFQKCLNAVIRRDQVHAFQYSDAEGDPALKESIADLLLSAGHRPDTNAILITNGGQEGIELVAKTLVSAGDYVVVEDPTYPGAIDVFETYGAKVIGVPLDQQGMYTEVLAQLFSQYRPKLVYTMPTFHNPTGITMAIERRKQLLELAAAYQVPVLEEDTCSELRYGGKELPSLWVLDGGENVIYVRTFSKLIMPGIRLGYIVAPPQLMERLVAVKQTMNLDTSLFMQRAMVEFIRRGFYQKHLKRVRQAYRERRDAMVKAIQKFFPKEASWNGCEGGIFLWVKVPPAINLVELYLKALEANVAFAIGTIFYVNQVNENGFRLNFTTHDPETITRGIKLLGDVLKHKI